MSGGLFNLASDELFRLHSGAQAMVKIDCDVLTDEDIFALAWIIGTRHSFGRIEGVPTGGLRLATALGLYLYEESDVLLIVDDVLTTGQSMEDQRAGRDAEGAVIFSRGEAPDWVWPVFQMGPRPWH